MRVGRIIGAAFAIAMASAGVASAATMSMTQVLTDNGQAMNFTFGALPVTVSSASLRIESGNNVFDEPTIRGIDIFGQNEWFELLVDGTSYGNYGCRLAPQAGIQSIPFPVIENSSNCIFALTNVFVPTSAFSDGEVKVDVDFSDAVGQLGHEDELIVTLSYVEGAPAPIPLPAGFPLLLGGLAVFGALRLRKQRKG